MSSIASFVFRDWQPCRRAALPRCSPSGKWAMLVSLPVLLENIAQNSRNASRFAGLVTNADLVKTPELRGVRRRPWSFHPWSKQTLSSGLRRGIQFCSRRGRQIRRNDKSEAYMRYLLCLQTYVHLRLGSNASTARCGLCVISRRLSVALDVP